MIQILRSNGYACTQNQVQDLARPRSNFMVLCSDETENFRMNTALLYGDGLDVVAWMSDHLATRNQSLELLHSARAVRR